ncbi:hypothetical protein C8R46DRAFT_1114344 [Mycena filopes]|nr:hypothetical protein C8R46DRAFT_1114344 [Mycena filopes]
MENLPQELVDAIIYEIDDFPTLKASCLAASIFRVESQRKLLRSFELNSMRSEDLRRLCTLLDESPHIRCYINRLVIQLFRVAPGGSEDVESVLKILAKLASVRECSVSELFMDLGVAQSRPLAAFMSTFLDFLSRQHLYELRVTWSSPISKDVFLRLLASAPVVTLADVSLTKNVGDETAQWQHHLPAVRDLTLWTGTRTLNEMLAHPQFRNCTERLLRLTIRLRNPISKLVAMSADTLQYLSFRGSKPRETILLPQLPALRSVEFCVLFHSLKDYSDSDFILDVLDRSPILTDLTFTLTRTPKTLNKVPKKQSQSMPALDSALALHPARPSIRWRFDLDLDGEDAGSRGDFVQLVALMQSALPQAHAGGRLVFKTYVLPKGGISWRRDSE